MDDRSKGLGDERTAGRSDEYVTGRAGDRTPAPTSRFEERTGTGASTGATGSSSAASSVTPREPAATDPRTRQIRAEIERTRGDMSETIDAIQDRLRPSRIASQTAANIRHAADERMRDVAESELVQDLRANPIPTAMIGIGIAGLAWLAFAGREGDRYRDTYRYQRGRRSFGRAYDDDDYYYRGSRWSGAAGAGYASAYEADADYDTGAGEGTYRRGAYGYGDTGESYREAAGDAASRAGDYAEDASRRTREYASDVSRRAGEYASDASRQVRYRARRTQNQLQRLMRENPLLAGAAAVVIGAAVGMALPETERENELMGEARDNVVDNVQHMARNAADRVQQAAGNVATNAASNVAAAAISGSGSESQEQQSSGSQEQQSTGTTGQRQGSEPQNRQGTTPERKRT